MKYIRDIFAVLFLASLIATLCAYATNRIFIGGILAGVTIIFDVAFIVSVLVLAKK